MASRRPPPQHRAPTNVRWERLSPRSLWSTIHLALPVAGGWTHAELAERYGRSAGWVGARMRELRQEIELWDDGRDDEDDA